MGRLFLPITCSLTGRYREASLLVTGGNFNILAESSGAIRKPTPTLCLSHSSTSAQERVQPLSRDWFQNPKYVLK